MEHRVGPRGLIGLLVLLVAGLPLFAAACAETPPAPAPKVPYTIVATVGMVADVAIGVAGDRAKVKTLLGAGADPHLYRVTRSDMAELLAGDVVFYNGLLLEGKMTDALIRVSSGGGRVFAVTERLTESDLRNKDGEEADYTDPHVWMDPTLWVQAVETVRKKLSEFDPAGAPGYAERAAAMTERFKALDEYVKKVIATIPEKSRVLITAHDAFGYFGRRYGIEVRGIQGISTESEAGVRDIEDLVSLIAERDIKAVFVEASVSERNVRALVDGVRARGKDVKIGGTLFSDSMGEPGTYEGTYVGMIDHNATTIARALGGVAPERGMDGKLAAPK